MDRPQSREQFTGALGTAAAAIGTALDRGQLDRLYLYYRELGRWNRRINLVSRRQPDWVRAHFADSLAAVGLGLIRGDERVVDLGAGAGFPGLVLKVACPGLFLAMAEASGKKCTWLRHVTRVLQLDGAQVLQGRFEEALAAGWAGQFDLAVSRAAAKPRDLVAEAGPFLARSGRVLAYTTEALVDPEIGRVHPYRIQGSEVPSVIWEVAHEEARRHRDRGPEPA